MADIPTHCVIEELLEGNCLNCVTGVDTDSKCRVLIDSYAIVSGRTLLSKLNDAVLIALGLPQFVSTPPSTSLPLPLKNEPPNRSKGFIVIDKWKPLSFDRITDDLETPIEDLFKHLGGNRWKLKIIVIPAAVVQNSMSMSEDSSISSTITPDDSVKGFDRLVIAASPENSDWYQLLTHYHPYLANYSGYTPRLDPPSASVAAFMANRLSISTSGESSISANRFIQNSPPSKWLKVDGSEGRREHKRRRLSGSMETSRSSTKEDPRAQQPRPSVLVSPRPTSDNTTSMRNPAQATCRLMFDPLTELPLLNEWFQRNSHPTAYDMESYTEILNSKPYRQMYPPVSIHNVKIWFKNRRAKCKRV